MMPAVALLMALATLAAQAATPATPQPARGPIAQPPLCTSASHERLQLREGRDICAPTLSPSGRPTAAGFMPTQCPRAGRDYRIDAVGLADRCLAPSTPEP